MVTDFLDWSNILGWHLLCIFPTITVLTYPRFALSKRKTRQNGPGGARTGQGTLTFWVSNQKMLNETETQNMCSPWGRNKVISDPLSCIYWLKTSMKFARELKQSSGNKQREASTGPTTDDTCLRAWCQMSQVGSEIFRELLLVSKMYCTGTICKPQHHMFGRVDWNRCTKHLIYSFTSSIKAECS